ncbi:MAG: threonine/serine exporter ThrE family protein [Eubacterium sp.]
MSENPHLLKKIHMDIPWSRIKSDDRPAVEASLQEKSTIVNRIGLMMLSVGTGAWRVRDSMNTAAMALGITCSVDVGLLTINCTCFGNGEHVTTSLSLKSSGVNTDKLAELESYCRVFHEEVKTHSIKEIHQQLDDIKNLKGNYSPLQAGFASAIACCAFTFLLGGGPFEMLCAFIGAGIGNFIRRKMLDHKLALFLAILVSVAAACAAYVCSIKALEALFGVSAAHQAGYICAMLFIIPGFPLITGGIDLAKQDMRSGLERLAYALLIILIATCAGWVTAYVLQFHPADFQPLPLDKLTMCIFRLICSFFGVFGFSLMFNSPYKTAMTAAGVGMIANTLRLELVDLAGLPIGLAAFLGALTAGLIASVINKKIGKPRISITVPSIVIMVPGLYMYRGIYYIALSNITDGALWLTRAALIVIALPIGLVAARLLTDTHFRHCS